MNAITRARLVAESKRNRSRFHVVGGFFDDPTQAAADSPVPGLAVPAADPFGAAVNNAVNNAIAQDPTLSDQGGGDSGGGSSTDNGGGTVSPPVAPSGGGGGALPRQPLSVVTNPTAPLATASTTGPMDPLTLTVGAGAVAFVALKLAGLAMWPVALGTLAAAGATSFFLKQKHVTA